MVKLKYMALAVGLAFASPSLAASPVAGVISTTTADEFDAYSKFTLAVSGMYDLGLSLVSTYTAPGSTFAVANLYSVTGTISNLVASVSGGTFQGTTSSVLSSSNTTIANLVAGKYKLVLSGFSDGTTAANATLTAVAVPGPEAGTGIAALAMAGVGALAYRRRQKTIA